MALLMAYWFYYQKNNRVVSFRKTKLVVNVFIFFFGIPNFSNKFIFGSPSELTCYEKIYSLEAIAYVSVGMIVGEEIFSLIIEPVNTLDIMVHHVSTILLSGNGQIIDFFFSMLK